MNDPTKLAASLQLTAPGLRLSLWQPSHAEALYEAVRESIPTVGRWLPWCHAGYLREDAAGWIERCRSGAEGGEPCAFGVFDDNGLLLGGVGLNRFDRQHRSANLGYWVRTQAQGRGVAARAARRLAAFGFDTLGLCRIEIVAAMGNLASRRCAEKTGARFEGIARHRLTVGGEPVDAAVYGLLPVDLDQPADAQSSAMS
ncbi:GNAT family N-acetyltransferase [Dyella sp. EPa41]|uniref:GNAT family N-acetyltransferase n=1 Tax=Dyella sp. EPa41 TaxID=1561194 RepID=UPI00191661E3|nr:GNAT family N-acetyltransferase [Dyella sp. EPa41]